MQESQIQLTLSIATERGQLRVPTQTSMGLRTAFKVVGLSFFLLIMILSSTSAQSMYSNSFSTGGVHLGQALTELQNKDNFDLIESKEVNLFYIDNLAVDIEDGLVVGIDFIGTLYCGEKILVKPREKKFEVCSRLVALPQSREGDFYSFEFPERVKLLLKFDEDDQFVNGYIKKL